MPYIKIANLQGKEGRPGAPGSDGAPGRDGRDGQDGPPNRLTVGTVTTVPPTSPAKATVTGDAPNQVVNFEIPQGPASPDAVATDTAVAGYITTGTTDTRTALDAVVGDAKAFIARQSVRGQVMKSLCTRVNYTSQINTRVKEEALAVAQRMGADTIQIVVNWYMANLTSSSWSEQSVDPAAVRGLIQWWKARGYRVQLKPHIEVNVGGWTTYLDPADPTAFWTLYQGWMGMWAALAEDENVDSFVVGSEYSVLVTKYPQKWRDTIATVRASYGGPVTYSAAVTTAASEMNQVTFWDALDFISAATYIRVSYNSANEPYPAATVASFVQRDAQGNDILAVMDYMAAKWGRPIMLGEYGYPFSAAGAEERSISDDFFTKYLAALLTAAGGRSWFLGASAWSMDAWDGAQWAADRPMAGVVGSIYSSWGPKMIETALKGRTDNGAGATAWSPVLVMTMPSRAGVLAQATIRISRNTSSSTSPRWAELFVSAGTDGAGVLGQYKVTQTSGNGPISDLGYTVVGNVLTVWASHSSGASWNSLILTQTAPQWTSVPLLPSQSTSTPANLRPVLGQQQPIRVVDTALVSGTHDRTWSDDCALWQFTLNGNMTLNLLAGPAGTVARAWGRFTQDATGGRTLTFSSAITPLPGTITLPAQPNATLLVEFFWDGTKWFAWVPGAGRSTRTVAPTIAHGAGSLVTMVTQNGRVTASLAFGAVGTLTGGQTLVSAGSTMPVPVAEEYGVLLRSDTVIGSLWVRADGALRLSINSGVTVSAGDYLTGSVSYYAT